jgi:hypothetical protein
VSTSR